jgi:hypothetical protein
MLHRSFEIAGQQGLHRIAVHRDQLAQEIGRQHLLAGGFLFHDDLGEDRMGQVCAALGVDHFELDVFLHHLGEVVERDVAGRPRVVETAVGVLLDDDGIAVLSLICHFYRTPTGNVAED